MLQIIATNAGLQNFDRLLIFITVGLLTNCLNYTISGI